MRCENDSRVPILSGQGAKAAATPGRLDDRGYIMVVLLISMAVAAIWMSAALPAWRQQSMREKELELIFRGEQYARAIALYQIKNNSYPINIEALVTQRYLRKKYKDPVTGEDFQIVGMGAPGQSTAPGGTGPGGMSTAPGRGAPAQAPGRGVPGGVPGGTPGRGTGTPGTTQLTGGITGVRSTSQATSIRVYNGQQQHNLWQFDAAMMMQRMGRNQQMPGGGPGRGDGRPGQPGARPGGAGPGGAPGRGVGPGRGPGPGGPPGGPGRGPGGGPGRGAGS